MPNDPCRKGEVTSPSKTKSNWKFTSWSKFWLPNPKPPFHSAGLLRLKRPRRASRAPVHRFLGSRTSEPAGMPPICLAPAAGQNRIGAFPTRFPARKDQTLRGGGHKKGIWALTHNSGCGAYPPIWLVLDCREPPHKQSSRWTLNAPPSCPLLASHRVFLRRNIEPS